MILKYVFSLKKIIKKKNTKRCFIEEVKTFLLLLYRYEWVVRPGINPGFC